MSALLGSQLAHGVRVQFEPQAGSVRQIDPAIFGFGQVAALGDWNGDGHLDLLSSDGTSPGTTYLLEGPFVIETRSDRFEGALDDEPMQLSLRTDAPDGHVELRLRGPSFRPSQRRESSKDGRELAAIVYELSRTAGLSRGPW